MANILYTIFIYPVEQVISLFFLLLFRAYRNPALSVLGVSFIVSVMTLPLYFMAERIQNAERNIQKRMKPGIDNIKAVFSGDERFMRLAVLYRQNGYHPLFSLSSSVFLIIQIPFFIAAYHFLSNLDVIKTIPFGPIEDLSKADSLVRIKGITVNILPVVMTLINIISSAIYSKGMSVKEKIQLYGLAGIFLVLLYDSPSAMVLYWTGNNIFSLIKNVLQKAVSKEIRTRAKKTAKTLFSESIFFSLQQKMARIIPTVHKKQESRNNTGIFIFSLIVLFLLAGLVVPSLLIASSVPDFSFLGNYESPFPFVANTLIQSLGIFIVWPLFIFFLLSQNNKKILAALSVIFTFSTIVNIFLFPGKFGRLEINFIFPEIQVQNATAEALNLFVICAVVLLVLFCFNRFKRVILQVLVLSVCAFMLLGAMNVLEIHKEFQSLESRISNTGNIFGKKIFTFSKTGKNVLIIMLDMAMSGYVPYIFEERPSLHNSFSGFTWYKNTVTFAPVTLMAAPGIFGGYEYTPLEMQARKDEALVDKHNEALLVMPRIFLDNGFRVTFTNPPLANYKVPPDLSVFSKYQQINVMNDSKEYTEQWMANKKQIESINLAEIVTSNLVRFSMFKFVPLTLKDSIYDNGNWMMIKFGGEKDEKGEEIKMSSMTLDNYAALDLLPEFTKVDMLPINACNIVVNDLPHSPSFLQFPDYVPSNVITSRGNGHFSDEEYYHVNMAAFILLGKWFDFLRANDIYDNTRIIIVSDHGFFYRTKLLDVPVLSNLRNLRRMRALLLVKDFDSNGNLITDNSFMTNADVPFLATKDIIHNPVNPWTGKLIETDKENGVTITRSPFFNPAHHQKNVFNIGKDQWEHIHANIFDPAN